MAAPQAPPGNPAAAPELRTHHRSQMGRWPTFNEPAYAVVTGSSSRRVVRCMSRTEVGSKGKARCSIPVLSHITRSPLRHEWRSVNCG